MGNIMTPSGHSKMRLIEIVEIEASPKKGRSTRLLTLTGERERKPSLNKSEF